ncbi:MAG: S1C family serine protease [Caulobacteraceae bacterium]
MAQQLQPKAEDFPLDLDWTLSSTVALRAIVPPDAFTAQILGTLRIGHAAVIGPDLVLTIGYLITEAEQVWLQTGTGKVVAGHPLGVDMASGLAWCARSNRSTCRRWRSAIPARCWWATGVIMGGGGRVSRSVAARLVGREEFAGYWEYVLDEALFTAPAHPMWSGAALIGPTGKLVGIGSLQMQQQLSGGKVTPLNMVVPIDLLPPILPALTAGGHDLSGGPGSASWPRRSAGGW